MTEPGNATAAQPAEFSAALSQMAGLVLSRETVDTAVALVTTLAETAIAGTAGAGVTIVDEQEQRSKAASNPSSSSIPSATFSPATSDTGGVTGASRVAWPLRVRSQSK